MGDKSREQIVPLVDEQATVTKRTVETGRVRVSTIVEERQTLVEEELLRDEVSIERIAIGREVDVVPDVRSEGDTIVIPVVEEVLVVEKRLVLKEELRIHRKSRLEHFEQPVTLKTTRAVVAREEGDRESDLPKAQE